MRGVGVGTIESRSSALACYTPRREVVVKPQSSPEHWDPPTRGGSALACGQFRVELVVSSSTRPCF